MNILKSSARDQQGAMLLESLIAILIFSIGILAIIGLQAASVRMSGDAKYRTDANLLVNKVIGQMWADDHTPAQLALKYSNLSGASGVGYIAWASDVMGVLPGVLGVPANQPTIAVVPVINGNTPIAAANATSSQITVTVFWQLPGEAQAQPPHSAMTVAQIR